MESHASDTGSEEVRHTGSEEVRYTGSEEVPYTEDIGRRDFIFSTVGVGLMILAAIVAAIIA